MVDTKIGIADDINDAAGNYTTEHDRDDAEATAEETPKIVLKASPSKKSTKVESNSPKVASYKTGYKAARQPKEIIEDYLFEHKG